MQASDLLRDMRVIDGDHGDGVGLVADRAHGLHDGSRGKLIDELDDRLAAYVGGLPRRGGKVGAERLIEMVGPLLKKERQRPFRHLLLKPALEQAGSVIAKLLRSTQDAAD